MSILGAILPDPHGEGGVDPLIPPRDFDDLLSEEGGGRGKDGHHKGRKNGDEPAGLHRDSLQ